MAQPRSNPADEVEKIIDQLDRLLRDMRLGRPSQQAYERFADIARRSAIRLDEAFRGVGSSVHPPLFASPDGTKAGW